MKLTSQQIYTQGVAILTFIIGQLVAFVPSMANSQEKLISGGSTLIALALAIGGAIHHVASTRSVVSASTTAIEQSAEDRLRQQIIEAGMTPQA